MSFLIGHLNFPLLRLRFRVFVSVVVRFGLPESAGRRHFCHFFPGLVRFSRRI